MGLLLFYEFCNLHNKVVVSFKSVFLLFSFILISESCPGGFSKLNPFPVFGRIPGSTRLWGFISLPLFSICSPFFHFDQPFDVASSHKPKESWCNWEGKPYNWVGPLPSVDMVSSGSVYASPTHIPFRDNENFIAGNVQANCHKWRTILLNYSKADEIFRYVSLGVDIQEFLRLLRERFRAVLMTRPFRLASSFLMRAIARTTRVLFLIALLKESEVVPFWLLAKLVLLTRPISSCPLR